MEPNMNETDPAIQADTAVQPEEARFCPNCGTKVEPGSVFCSNCGYRIGEADPDPAADPGPMPDSISQPAPAAGNRKKKARLPWLIGGAVAIVAVLAAGILVVPKAIGALAGAGGSGKTQEVFYLKGKSLYGASLKSAKKKPVEYTDHFADSDSLDSASYGFYGAQFVSKDGKYHFFMDKVEDNNYDIVYTLYSQKGNHDPVKIDSNIENMYQVTDDNKVVYMKNDNLYVNDLKDKAKIASDVDEFLVDRAGKNVLWTVENDDDSDEYDVYYQDLAMKKDKKKLMGDVDQLAAVSPDLNTLLLMRDDSLYLVRNQGDKEKLAGDVDKVLSTDLDQGTIFYFGHSQDAVNAMDFVNDDMAAGDAQITEPVIENYQHSETVGEGYWAYTRTVVDDRYYTDLRQYNEKVERDNLRKELSGMKIDNPYPQLYVYSNGQAQLVSDKVTDWRGVPNITDEDRKINKDFTACLLYQKAKDSPENKVKLSELSNADELEGLLDDAKDQDVTTCLYAGGKEAELDLDGTIAFDTVRIDVKNNQLYCLLMDSDSSEKGELASISLSGADMGKATNRDSDVNLIALVSNGNAYYLKDVKDAKEAGLSAMGDLYCNGQQVMTDVSAYKIMAIPDSTAILCIADPDPDDAGIGTLTLLKGKTAVKIADDVSFYHAFGENSIVMLTDYNFNRYKGDLKYYNGKKLRDLDSDVHNFFY